MNLPKLKRTTLVVFYILFLCMMVTVSFYLFKSLKIYNFIKKDLIIHSIEAYESDSRMGLVAKKKSIGYIIFPGGDSIPIFTNEYGNRVGSTKLNDTINIKKKVLFLGDSFTFGDANFYENSFPYLISKKLNHQLINASMVGYSYVHYQIMLDSLITSHSPDLICIQISPYSSDRSISGYLNAYVKIPTPFYYNKNNRTFIHNPLYQSSIFDIFKKNDINTYKSKKKSFLNFIKFTYHFSFPLFSHELINEIKSLDKKLKTKNRPDNDLVLKIFIQHINSLNISKEQTVIFYNIGYEPNEFEEIISNLKNEIKFNYVFANFEKELYTKINNNKSEYFENYGHWRGNPPKLVDEHYNELAHKIVSSFFLDVYNNYFTDKQTILKN